MAEWVHCDVTKASQLEDPAYLWSMLTHPALPAVVGVLEDLLLSLRATSAREELHDVQLRLARRLLDSEQLYNEARRLQKRGEADERDAQFWDRTLHQLRAIGDAIAWRFLDHRRQWLLYLGRNQRPGPTLTKSGFNDELELFERHWEAGEPTVLTGLTNNITIGDLLVAQADVLTVMEVKRDRRNAKGAQMRRIGEVVRLVNEDPRVDGPTGPLWILESAVPLVSHWTHGAEHVARAMDQGVAIWVPAPGVAVTIVAPVAAARSGRERHQALVEEEQVSAAATFGPAPHRVQAHSLHYPYIGGRAAPISILPLPATQVASLLAGETQFTVELDVDVLADVLRSHGFTVRDLCPPGAGPVPNPFLAWSEGVRRGNVHAAAIEQLAIELTSLQTWASGLKEARLPDGVRRGGVYICHAAEGEVWQ